MDKDKKRWKQIEINRKPFDVKAERLFYKALKSLIAPYLEKLKVDEYANHIQYDLKFYDIPIRKALLETYEKTGLKFSQITRKELKKSKGVQYDYDQLQDDKIIQDMRDYALNNSGSHITWITQTAENEALSLIREVVDESIKEGWSIEKTAQTMRQKLGTGYSKFARMSATRIARTEVNTASNYGQLLGAESTGYDMKKRWIATYDSRVRDSHAQAGSRYKAGIKLKEFYQIGDSHMMHPGDPNGGASEVINCRCTQAFEVL